MPNTPTTIDTIRANEGPLATLRLALWFGLLAGIGEVALLAVRKHVLHRLTLVSAEAVWMAPVADAGLFVVAGILMLALRAVLPNRFRPPVVLVFAALAAFTLLLMYRPLYRPAAALLALGIGTVTFRLARRWSTAFERTVSLTLPILVIGVALTAAVRIPVAGNHASGTTGAATAQVDAPDVLFIVLDTVRAWNLSVYGYSRPTTPEIERWMRDGVRFEHALSVAPWTLPSHATMFTGRFPHELTADWLTSLDTKYPTLAEVLSARGYATAGFVGNTLYCSEETGLARGFSYYRDYEISARQILLSSSLAKFLGGRGLARHRLFRKNAGTVNSEFLDWLNRRQDARPYFVFLNYYDAHDPYRPPAAFDSLYSTPRDAALIEDLDDSIAAPKLPPDVHRAAIGEYDESITYLDHELGRLFAELKRQRRWDKTLVVITADHGEEFGERGLYFHGNGLYRAGLEVPLLMRLPATIPAGRSMATPVSLKDLPATVLGLSGARAELPGRSLARFWNGQVADSTSSSEALLMELNHSPRLPKDAPVAKGPMKAVLLHNLKLIRNGDGSEELYDFAKDRTDSVDLAGLPEYRGDLQRLRKELDTLAATLSSAPERTGTGPSATLSPR